jgi:two-component system, cell cycle sensor histidine kinase and response regulator CckA
MVKEKKTTILLVEDNRLERQFVADMIAEQPGRGFVVKATETLTEGFEFLRQNEVNLVLLDLNLPDSQGIETLSTLVSSVRSIPIIVISALEDEKIALEALSKGASDYLLKGHFDGHSLVRSMRYALERKRIEEDLRLAHLGLEEKVQERTLELRRINERLAAEIAERKEMEKQLKESAEMYAGLFENSIEGVFAVDLKGNFTQINKAFEDISGYDHDEVIGQNFRRVMSDETAEKVFKTYNRLYLTGDPVKDLTYEFLRKDGQRRSVEGYVNAIRKDDKIIGFQGTLRDITERDLSLEALRESEERFRNLFENSIEAVLTVDIRGTITSANQAFSEMSGYTVDELIGKNYRELITKEDVQRTFEAYNRLYRTGEPIRDMISSRVHKNGEIRTAQSYVNVIRKSNEIVGFQATIRDITEKQKMEAALIESEQRLKLAVEAAQIGLWDWDMPSDRVIRSEWWFRMLDYQPDEVELTVEAWSSLVHPDDLATSDKAVNEHLAGKTPFYQTEYRMRAKSGNYKWILDRGQVISRDDAGRPLRALGTHMDITERKRTEEVLHESEIFLKETQKIARLGGWKANPHTDYLEWTDGVYDIIEAPYDYKPGLTEGMKYYPAEYIPVIKEKVSNCLETGEPFLIEVEVITETGRRLWTEVRGLAPVTEGERSYVIGTFQDTTERKKTIDAIKESEERYRSLFANSIEAAHITDLNGKIVVANGAFQAISGYSGEELIGMSYRKVLDPENADKVRKAYLHLYNTAEPIKNLIYDFITKDGSRRTVEAYVNNLYYEGKIVGFQGTFRDITERKRAETALRISEEKYRNVIENAQEAIIIIVDGVIQYANPMTEKLTGYTLDELKSKTITEMIYPENHEGMMKEYLRKLSGDPLTYPSEFRYITKDGEIRWYDAIAMAISWEGKSAILTFARDITDRKNLEKQLMQSQKMEAIGSMAGGIAHNFNNILVGIMGYSEYLLNKRDEDDPEYKALKTIFDGAIKASQLTRQLLNLTRAGEYQLKRCDLNSIIDKVIPLVMGTFNKSIDVRTKLGMNLPSFNADSSHLEQCLLNLCINARDAMPSGGSLLIETCMKDLDEAFIRAHIGSQTGKHLVLTVSDTGVGMSQEVRDHIFEPFFTTKLEQEGTGMGLATVYGTVKKHRGFITVYSEPGEGTTFRLYFPVTRATSAEAQSEDTIKESRGHETILIIDDELDVREIWAEYLRNIGYSVILAENGEQGISLFSENKDTIDLIILDVIMPKMGGKDALNRIKEIDPDTKILIASGYSENGKAGEIITDDVDGFIQKPTTLRELSEKVSRVLGNSDS